MFVCLRHLRQYVWEWLWLLSSYVLCHGWWFFVFGNFLVESRCSLKARRLSLSLRRIFFYQIMLIFVIFGITRCCQKYVQPWMVMVYFHFQIAFKDRHPFFPPLVSISNWGKLEGVQFLSFLGVALSLSLLSSHTHKHSHAHERTHMHTHSHARTHTHTLSLLLS